MFNKVYYDMFDNRMYHWFYENGKQQKEIVKLDYKYYVEDNTKTSQIKDIYGINVLEKHTNNKENLDQIIDSGMKTWETDIPRDILFLQDRWKNKEIESDISLFNIAFIDIELESQESFKAELAIDKINLITVYFSKTKTHYTFGLKEYTGNSDQVKNYCYCEYEHLLLERFFDCFRKNNPDIITGWYVDFFDIPYIMKRMEKLNVQRSLSPINITRKHGKDDKYIIAGVAVLDYIDLYKKFAKDKLETYSLGYVGLVEVKEGKMEFEGQISDLYKRDWNKFVEYNIQDVLLVKKIDDKLKYIQLMVTLSHQALIPFEKAFSPIAVHTGYITKFLHAKNIVMPCKVKNIKDEEYPGAYVYAKEGMFKYVVSFDVESMYPHMILQYNISPETLRLNPTDYEIEKNNLIKTPIDGIYYERNKRGVLPDIVDVIFNERKLFKTKKYIRSQLDKNNKVNVDQKLIDEVIDEGYTARYYDEQQYIRKILINSLYGILGNKHFHFYNIYNAKAITLSAQHLIKYLSESINTYFKDYFYKNKKYFSVIDEKNKLKNDIVCLVDTDSNYISFDEVINTLNLKFKDNNEFLAWFNVFNDDFLIPFIGKLLKLYADKWGVENIINFKREKICDKLIVLAKKKYVASVLDNEGEVYPEPVLKITGVEVVRSSTPKFCRDNIKDVIKEILKTNDKNIILNKIRKIRDEFKVQDVSNIAFPRGVSDYDKYSTNITLPRGILTVYPKACPIHVRASINYNILIKKYNLNLIPISNGTKIKFIFVKEKNELSQNIIGFIGNYPKEFNSLFKIDYEEQFEKSFLSVLDRFFEVLNWGTINLDNQSLLNMFED